MKSLLGIKSRPNSSGPREKKLFHTPPPSRNIQTTLPPLHFLIFEMKTTPYPHMIKRSLNALLFFPPVGFPDRTQPPHKISHHTAPYSSFARPNLPPSQSYSNFFPTNEVVETPTLNGPVIPHFSVICAPGYTNTELGVVGSV